MAYKHIFPKSKLKKIGLTVISLLLIFSTIKFIEYQQHKMCIKVLKENLDDIEDRAYPLKKKCFNAKKWILKKQYFRVSDYYLIDINGINFPLNDQYAQFISKLYSSMKYKYPKLAEQPLDEFYSHIKDTLKLEYLTSEFDQEMKAPSIHNFIISFVYKGTYFETTMHWESDTKWILISPYDFSTQKDYRFNNISWLTYRKYIEQQKREKGK